MTTDSEPCPHCGQPCIVFTYGMLPPPWEQAPDDPHPGDGFDRSQLLVVQMGCAIEELPDGSLLRAYCPGCDVAYDPAGEPIAWRPAWGHPTDAIAPVSEPQAFIEEWIGGDPAYPVDDVLVIAELAAWRHDVALEIAARTRALGRLITQDDYELAHRVATATLPLLDRQPSPAAARDVHAGLARVASAGGDTALALDHWRLALQAGELAADLYDLSWVQADAAADAQRAGEHRWALDLSDAAIDELEGYGDRDVAAMTCTVAASAATADGQFLAALSWALRGAANELDDDGWHVSEATRLEVEARVSELAPADFDEVQRMLGSWRGRLQQDRFDHHAEAHRWITAVMRRLG